MQWVAAASAEAVVRTDERAVRPRGAVVWLREAVARPKEAVIRPEEVVTAERAAGPWRRRLPLLIVIAAIIFHVACAATLMPTAGQPYDLASLTGASEAWLRWGFPLLYNWKFGLDLSLLGVGAQGLRFLLEQFGMSGSAALATAWKVPLVLSDLLVGLTLLDLGRILQVRRPALIPTLWLISPVSLWVSAGHGQVESLTVLSFVLSLDLLLRRRPLLAGVVIGLGIGIEFLPAGILLAVGLCLYIGVVRHEEVVRLLLGMALAVGVCFLPSFVSTIGRESLFSGLGFTVSVTTASTKGGGAAAAGSSLWSIFGLSPGKEWLVVMILAGGALLVILALRARRSTDVIERQRLAMVGAGGLLLCVVLLDPGALPQFADLALGALCLVGLAVDLSPLAIIVGPMLQLVAGLLFVYGGDFQSYWYDMWVKTGNPGWPFPDSLPGADAAALAGAAVILGGLVLAVVHWAAPVVRRVRVPMLPVAIGVGIFGSAFLAIWCVQPAYWQGVGRHGPSTLADFEALTATRQGTVSTNKASQTVTFSPVLAASAKAAVVPPTLLLSAEARPFYSATRAVVTVPGNNMLETVTIPNWAREKADVGTLWVSVLVGRPSWVSPVAARNGRPVLVAGSQEVAPSETQWLVPGFCLIAYDIPAKQISPSGHLALILKDGKRADPGGGLLVWNGTSTTRWVLVDLHQGEATVKIDGTIWQRAVNLAPPVPGSDGNEDASIAKIPPTTKINITKVVLGGERAKVVGGALQWPVTPLDRTFPVPVLLGLGAFDLAVLIGGALALAVYLERRRPKAADVAAA